MAFTDPIADCLTRIRNAQKAKQARVQVWKSKMNSRIVEVLKKEGFVQSFQPVDKDGKSMIEVELRYTPSRASMIREIKRISSPGCRRYASVDKLKEGNKTMATLILSTSKGIMTDNQARKENVGGEIICTVS
jgi:small subunit ribosomal protein S8